MSEVKVPLPLRDDSEYDPAVAVAEKLYLRDEKDLEAGERDYLDALDEFIAAYDRKHFSLGSDDRTPLQRLKFILNESGTTPAHCGRSWAARSRWCR